MNPTLSRIREKIIEAVPEILTKDFGCRIKWGGGIKYEAIIVHADLGGGFRVMDTTLPGGKIMGVRPNQINEVIGRPITIADVLRAMDTMGSGYHSGSDVVVATNGHFAFVEEKMTRDVIEKWEGVYWNLALSLDDQEPEVWDFLDRVLNPV